MLYYNRQIIYLDHMEAGNKIKNSEARRNRRYQNLEYADKGPV